MIARGSPIVLVSALCLALLGAAFLVAPHSCEWGLTAYFWLGVAVTITLLVIPFAMKGNLHFFKRVLASLGLVALAAAVWVAGLYAADIQVICRLF